MSGQAAPRPAGGAQQVSTDRSRLAGELVPQLDLAPDYIALAALLHHPDLAAPQVSNLHPSAWLLALHQIAARILLAHLTAFGRADRLQLLRLLHDGGIGPDCLALELLTVERVAGLLDADLVRWAAAALTARRGVAA